MMHICSRHISSLYLGLALVIPTFTVAEQPFSFETTPGLLPKTAVPLNYTLRIQPDLEQRTTKGSARIEFNVTEPMQEIMLHALELEFDSISLIDNPEAPIVLSYTVKKETQTVTIPVNLSVGRHTLLFNYRGKIGTSAEGFFVDHYNTPHGKKTMLGTQFEVADARRTFPCWDEPVFRATYDITLVIPAQMMGVSNMPVMHEEPVNSRLKAVTFARSPSMPSYLVAMYAGEFEVVEIVADGVTQRVITTEGKRESARYALEVSQRVLAYHNAYFGTKYPLPKLDHVAVPNAFSGFSAMENWGCISYIDTVLLFDPATASQASQEYVFSVIAHEMAHHWFGNLVTMSWWDNLWLNEGFASWLESKLTDALNPEWKISLRANKAKESAMELDAKASTHPIQQNFASEMQAANSFDSIAYSKGQAFLRMLEAYLGEASFREGIRLYIRNHSFSNTTTADLWAALDAATGKPVSTVASDWTERPGFPIVTVSVGESNGQRQLILQQTRFTYGAPIPDSQPWHIPVTYAALSQINNPSVVLMGTNELILPWPEGEGPIKLNVGDNGFYRVQYDETLGHDLQLHIAEFPPADQLNLLADTWALAKAGRLPVTRWLDLASALGSSKELAILENILATLDTIDDLEIGTNGRRAYQTWARSILDPLMQRFGWEAKLGEAPLIAPIRSDVISLLGNFGDEATIATANAKFQAYLRDSSTLPGNLISSVFRIVGRYADRATYDQLHAPARSSVDSRITRRAYSAMQSALDPKLTQATLELTMDDSIPVSEANRNLERLSRHLESYDLVVAYAMEHFDELIKRVSSFEAYGYLPGIMSPGSDVAKADELIAFIKVKQPPEALPFAERSAEGIRDRAIFKQRALPAIDAWVRDRLDQLPE